MTTTASPTAFLESLREIVGPDGVLDAKSELLVCECDAFVLEKRSPQIVARKRLDGEGNSLVTD